MALYHEGNILTRNPSCIDICGLLEINNQIFFLLKNQEFTVPKVLCQINMLFCPLSYIKQWFLTEQNVPINFNDRSTFRQFFMEDECLALVFSWKKLSAY